MTITNKESGDYFWFGLGLGYMMVFDFTLACAQARSVMLIEELARGEARKCSLKSKII